jgi:hypothetical protein
MSKVPGVRKALQMLGRALTELKTILEAKHEDGKWVSGGKSVFKNVAGITSALDLALKRLDEAKDEFMWIFSFLKSIPSASELILSGEAERFWKKYCTDPKVSATFFSLFFYYPFNI